jgi:hypothetical protein
LPQNAREGPKWRFTIVVFNHGRTDSFLENSWRLSGLSSADRVIFITSSASPDEEQRVRSWAEGAGVHWVYVPRINRGIDFRCDFFTGAFAETGNLADSRFIFQMQDHYLDTESPWSRWDRKYENRIKGDVIPDLILDLDAIEKRMDMENCVAAFADRNNPAWLEYRSEKHIVPSGANFIVRTESLLREDVQHALSWMKQVCDNRYRWALWAEYMWGVLIFRDGTPVYDIKRDRVFRNFRKEDFFLAGDNFALLNTIYSDAPLPAAIRFFLKIRRVIWRGIRKLLPAP